MFLDVVAPTPVEDAEYFISEYWVFILLGIIALIGLYVGYKIVKRKLLSRIMYGKRGR